MRFQISAVSRANKVSAPRFCASLGLASQVHPSWRHARYLQWKLQVHDILGSSGRTNQPSGHRDGLCHCNIFAYTCYRGGCRLASSKVSMPRRKTSRSESVEPARNTNHRNRAILSYTCRRQNLKMCGHHLHPSEPSSHSGYGRGCTLPVNVSSASSLERPLVTTTGYRLLE